MSRTAWRWYAPLLLAVGLLMLAQTATGQPEMPGTITPDDTPTATATATPTATATSTPTATATATATPTGAATSTSTTTPTATATPTTTATPTATPVISGVANRLYNGSFECGAEGYYTGPVVEGGAILIPNGWTLYSNLAMPVVYSARIFFEKSIDPVNGGCNTDRAHVEKLDGRDSVLVRALDLETPPEPGKPFDVALIQTVTTVSGVAYSLSGWMVSLCGGSFNNPNDCPDGYYIDKMLGADPTGGLDPNATTVVWTSNRNNFNDGGWRNLKVGVTAAAPTMTVFARVNSPFQWHGNHAFMDAMTMVVAPTAAITIHSDDADPAAVNVGWDGSLGPDIPLIAGGNFELLYEIEYWHATFDDWRKLETDFVGPGTHAVRLGCPGTPYRFRARVRAEQPHGTGVFPTQRYVGGTAETEYTPAMRTTPFGPLLPQPFNQFLPAVTMHTQC